MFKHLSHFKFALLYIFSKQARFAGKFDERDLLLGHGIDNLTSIRVVVSLCCAIAVYLLVNFVLSSQVISALLFILVMEVLCWYTMHLPRSGMEQALHNNFAKLKEHRSYRSYFNGRILFTPYGLSLSLKARNAQTVSKERNEQAKRILSLQPQSTNRFSQWSNKVKEVNHKINAHSHKELSCVQVTQGLSKAQSEHNARLYLSGHGHKSTAMILQSGVSVDDYVIAQGILASTADDRDLPVINSGYITKLPVPLLCDQRLYAGKKITMEAIAQILCASAMQESNKQHRKFVPTDLCLLGFGFEWLPKHSRALRQIMAVGTKAAPLGGDGSPDIHAVEPDFAYEPIVTSTNKLKGHTLLLGTTGSGKTRFFDLLVSQAIMRGDTVIVLDPKGDRDLQRSIIKAARAAEREPYQQIICLDIGRNVSNPLSSNVAIDYAAASTGSLKQFAMDSQKISDTQSVAPLSPFERSRKSLTKKGYFSLINNDFYERQGCDLGFDKAADTKERRSFKYQHRHYISEHNETAASIRATNIRYDDPNFATVTGEDPDNCLFDEINFGLNPTAIFDRGSEVSSRLTSMISGQGSSANFKAYAAMAITAAVECCRLLDENVTLDAIRGYIANHQRFIIAVRDIINKTVVNLNNVYCSRYYNCIYGIKDDKLVRNAYTISVLMANGYKYINLRERASVLSVLENSGLLDASDAQIEDSEKIKQIENIIDNQSLTKEIISDKAASKKTSSKTTTAKENKPRYLAAPAPIKSLQEFYVWMTKNGYLDRDNSIEQIFEVCLMDPVFFQKVTNSIMPSLVSLTSGVLKQLLSADDYKQTNFMEIVRNNKIFYGALHCLKDSITGQNLGKLLMADLAFVAGEINAKNIQGHHQVSVFIDEASELANEVLVQLLNKSRASNFAVTIATQSVADLRARVNSKDVAEQLIANCNNLLSLRVEDMDTANVIANVLPNTVCTHESTTISVGSGGLTGNASASRSLSQQDCEYFPGTMLMQLPNFEFIARLANGSCYKGFIPIIDKENSGHQRPEFTAAHEAQAFAQEQNKRMRSQTFEPRPNNTTSTNSTSSTNISPTPQRTSDFATSSPMEKWACPQQSQPNSNGSTAPTSRQYNSPNNNANTSCLNSPISPVSELNDSGCSNGITAPLNGGEDQGARLDNSDGYNANTNSLNGPISSCSRLDNFDGYNANTSSLNGPVSPVSGLNDCGCSNGITAPLNGGEDQGARLDNFDGYNANTSSLNGSLSSVSRLDNFDGSNTNISNLNGPISSCSRLDNFGCSNANTSSLNGSISSCARLDNFGCSNANTSSLNSNVSPCSRLDNFGCNMANNSPISGGEGQCARLDNFDGSNANTNSLNGPISSGARLNNFGCSNANTSSLNGPVSSCARLDNFDGSNANISSLNGPTSSCARLDNFDGSNANTSSLNGPVSSCARLDNFDGCNANTSSLNGPVSSCSRLDNFGCSNANTSSLNGPVSSCARLDNFDGSNANASSLNSPVSSCSRLDNFYGYNDNTNSLNGPTSSCQRLDNFGCNMANNGPISGVAAQGARLDNFDGSNTNTSILNGPVSSCARLDNFGCSNTNTSNLNAPISSCARLDNFDGSNTNTSSLNGPVSSCSRLDNFDGSNANISNLNGPISSCARLDNFDGSNANTSSLNGPISSCSRLDNFGCSNANNSYLNDPLSSCSRLDSFGCNMANKSPTNGGAAQGARLDNSGKAQDMGQGAKGTWWHKIMECLHISDSYRENTSNKVGHSKCSDSGDEADIYRNCGRVGNEFIASCQQGNEGAITSKNDGDGLNAKDIDGKPLVSGENFAAGNEKLSQKKISGCTFGQNMLKIEIALQDASRDKFNDTATSSLSLAQSLVTLPSSHHDPQRQRFNAYVQARRNAQALQNLKVQARQNPCTSNNTPIRQSDFAPNLQFHSDATGNLQTQHDLQERMNATAQAQAQVQAQACTQAHAYAQAQAQESEARSIQNHATDIELKLSSSRINEELTLEQAAIMLGQDPKYALEANLTPDNVKLDGPTVGRYGYKAGNSRQTLNQETKVYVGNEQSLLYSHFSDEQYHPKSSDDLVQRQSVFTNTASATGASSKANGEASAASAASASGATDDGSTNRTSGTDGIRGIRSTTTTGALSFNGKRGEPQLSSNSSHLENNFSPAPIMVSALSTSKSKMDRDYEQAQTYSRQKLKSNERNLLTIGGEIQAQYGLTGLAIWFLRVLFYPLEWALKVLIKVCFNQSLLKNLAIAKELMMLLLAGLLIAWCFKPDQITVLTKSISDFCSYCYDFGAVVYFALFNGFSQVNEALYADSSILDRLELYAQLLFDHVECALTCFALGLLWGNHYGLISEMHHRSLLGLRTLLRPYSFLNLSLSLSAVALLIGGYFPCLEYALLITWFKIALYGFTITCFYSQHSK